VFWIDLAHVALLALLGTGHCIGMCGAFAVAAGTGEGGRPAWFGRQVAYALGKGTAYAFLGVALMLVGRLAGSTGPLAGAQDALGWVIGGGMIFFGLLQLTEWRLAPGWDRWWRGSRLCGAMVGLGRSSSPFKGLLVGWVNGFLPCGLTLTALLYLVGTRSALTLTLGAYLFSLATLPGLMATAALARGLGVSGRRWLLRAAGALLIGLGLLTIVRGREDVHHWLHQHLMMSPAAVEHAENGAPDQ